MLVPFQIKTMEPPGYILAILVLVSACCVHGFPDGAPIGACFHMKPGTQVGTTGLEGHTSMPQNLMPGARRLSPFYIEVHTPSITYEPNEEIKGMVNEEVSRCILQRDM